MTENQASAKANTRFYEVDVKVLVVAPPNFSRATEKWVHGLVQDFLPGMSAEDSPVRIVGASAIGSTDVGESDDNPEDA